MNGLDDVTRFIDIARRLARARPDFLDIKGPGHGNLATTTFMRELQREVASALPGVKAEQRICGKNNFAFDFYLPDQAAVIEVALGLRNSLTEFERDVFKVLLALDEGCSIKRLVFISKPGAVKRHGEPGPAAIISWIKKHHDVTVEIHEMGATAVQQ
jgi:hypothetical protein